MERNEKATNWNPRFSRGDWNQVLGNITNVNTWANVIFRKIRRTTELPHILKEFINFIDDRSHGRILQPVVIWILDPLCVGRGVEIRPDVFAQYLKGDK